MRPGPWLRLTALAALALFGLAAAVTAPGLYLALAALAFAATLVTAAQSWSGATQTSQQTVATSRYSLAYLALLFVAMAVGAVI
jgi:heme O synthase-like polyprenyltransferase